MLSWSMINTFFTLKVRNILRFEYFWTYPCQTRWLLSILGLKNVYLIHIGLENINVIGLTQFQVMHIQDASSESIQAEFVKLGTFSKLVSKINSNYFKILLLLFSSKLILINTYIFSISKDTLILSPIFPLQTFH